ncbi:CLUMA_CG014593, isoform A [Clunio marinus]|uniref:CLUMA_CG014593, isoform A n=1 Tax=Clunio marinus TaxID=568069 RepID=A0A1J1IRY4_9DIPT|nr:CLUMA_CG014593, isoform A [Clunio marinus]
MSYEKRTFIVIPVAYSTLFAVEANKLSCFTKHGGIMKAEKIISPWNLTTSLQIFELKACDLKLFMDKGDENKFLLRFVIRDVL